METLTVTNCHAERVYVYDPAAAGALEAVIYDLEPTVTWLQVEPAGVCLADDADEHSCNRLAFHDGPHAYIREDVLVTFTECHCVSRLGDTWECAHYQDACGDADFRFTFKSIYDA